MANRPEWLPLQFPAGEEISRVREAVAALFRTKSREEWLELAERHDVCLSSVNRMEELEADPQLGTANDHRDGVRERAEAQRSGPADQVFPSPPR